MAPTRTELALEAHEGFPSRNGSAKIRRARATLARALWHRDGTRRLPGEAALDDALSGLSPGELAWTCEFAPLGPLYFLPTRRFVLALAKKLKELGARRVLEVAAGDGFLSRALASVDGSREVIATDSGAWSRPAARMSARDQRACEGVEVPGIKPEAGVIRMSARRAIERYAPDVVLASWLPPGRLLDGVIRTKVKYVLEIGAVGDVTAGPWSWRFAHETCDGVLEQAARCRLDARPRRVLHSRVTLYFGGAHEEHHEQRVREGDWLWGFRPGRARASTLP